VAGVAAAVLRASGLQDSTRGVAGEKNKGQRGPRFHGGEQLLGSGLTGGDGFGLKSWRGRGATSELRSQGGSRGLGKAAAQLVVDWGAAGRRGRGGAEERRGVRQC